MSNLVNDIQTIAKTHLLEEKISKAMSQSDTTLNSEVSQSQVQSERSIGVADGTTSTGTTTDNNTTVVVQGGSSNTSPLIAVGYIPAAQSNDGSSPNDGNGNISLANLSGGLTAAQDAAQQVAAANAILNQPLNNGTNSAQQGANESAGGRAGGGSNTNQSSKVTASSNTPTQNTGGIHAYNTATNGANAITATADGSQLAGLQASSIYTNSNVTDQTNFTQNYIDQNWNSQGNVTANQIQTNNYSPNYNPFEDQLQSIIGFDPKGTISSITGGITALKVMLYNNNTFPTPTAADALFGSQNTTWASPTVLPPYNDFALAKKWSVTAPEPAAGSTPSQCMDAAIASLRSINPGGIYTYAWWDVASLTPSGGNYTAKWYSDKRNSSSPPNTTTITGAACTPPSTNCPLVAPTYTAWPKTGISMLTLTGGQLGFSPYDTELPQYLKYPSTSVTLNCGDGVRVVNSNYMTISPGVNGGYVISTFNAGGTFQWGSFYDAAGRMAYTNLNQGAVNLLTP